MEWIGIIGSIIAVIGAIFGLKHLRGNKDANKNALKKLAKIAEKNRQVEEEFQKKKAEIENEFQKAREELHESTEKQKQTEVEIIIEEPEKELNRIARDYDLDVANSAHLSGTK